MKRLIAITCIDEGDFRLLYHYDTGGKVTVEERAVPRAKPTTESIFDKYPSAEPYEREIHDFFGVEFEGNPNLHLRFVLPEGKTVKYPLRRDVGCMTTP